MSKRIINPSAQRTYQQINSVLEMLFAKHLVIAYNKVPPPDIHERECQITWLNHISDRANSGKSFTKLEQYLHILNTNSYHCLLLDGSIIRANFQFKDDILVKENLLWWPSPYDYGGLLEEGFSPVELINDFFCDEKWHQVIKMRSPIRVDYDGRRITEPDHPYCHMHIEHEEARLDTRNPICFSRFVDFIFKNFFPEYHISFLQQDFIEYKVGKCDYVEYTTSHVIF